MIRGKFLCFDDGLDGVLALRREVFCRELGATDNAVIDGLDEICMNVVAFDDDGNIIATGRALANGSDCELSFVCVKKELRRQKYGDFIVRMLCDRTFAAGIPKVTVKCGNENAAFFGSIGFETEREQCGIKYMYLNSEDFTSPCQKCKHNTGK